MARAVTKAKGRSFAVGVAVVAVFAAVMYAAVTANQGRLPGTPTTTVRAAFADVGQLQAGSEVRRNGMFVGRVSAIDLHADEAVVTMELNGDVPVFADAYAGIWDQSALAQKFVELRSGTDAAGPLGDRTIPLGQTESTHDLVDVLDVFQPDTRAALGSALRSLGGGVAGYGPGLHDLIADAPQTVDGSGTIVRALSSDRADLPAMLRSADRLGSRFAGREAQLTSVIAQTDVTMRAVGVDGGGPLAATLEQLPQAFAHSRTALDAVHQSVVDAGVAMTDLQDGAVALGEATPDVRGVFREAIDPLDTLPDVADAAEPAVDELTDVFTDARPFVPRLADGLDSAAEPLSVLAPYASDIGTFAFDIGNLIEGHNGWEHRLRIMVGAAGAPAVVGALVQDTANPYPAPGEAIRDRDTNGGLIPGTGSKRDDD